MSDGVKIGVAVILIVLGYTLQYVAVTNLMNGGNGPRLFEAMGFTGKLASPADNKPAQGSGNMTGQPPSLLPYMGGQPFVDI
jgi:hypothetical protein